LSSDSARIGRIVIVALALGSVAAAAGPTRRQFPIPGKGSLSLDVPAEWRVRSSPLLKPPSLTLSIQPATGDEFQLEVTSVWMEAKASIDQERLKEVVRQTLNQALPHAVETEAPLVEFRGKETAGYCFSVTERTSSNKSRDQRYVTQGAAATGPIISVFTFLSRSADPAGRERALEVLSGTSWSDTPLPEAVKPEPGSIQVEESAQSLRLTVPASRVVMLVPRGGLKKGAELERPGYFHFTDEARSLVVSGWFEPAERFRGVKEFWQDETRNPALKDPQDVTFAKVGDWDAILYEMRVRNPRVTNSHVRAHWVGNGTWIDVHLSTTGKRARPECRARLLKVLGTFRVEQKD
jgi:hypothetical protein